MLYHFSGVSIGIEYMEGILATCAEYPKSTVLEGQLQQLADQLEGIKHHRDQAHRLYLERGPLVSGAYVKPLSSSRVRNLVYRAPSASSGSAASVLRRPAAEEGTEPENKRARIE